MSKKTNKQKTDFVLLAALKHFLESLYHDIHSTPTRSNRTGCRFILLLRPDDSVIKYL